MIVDRSFFPRGDGPLVTVTLISRGRSEHLLRAIDSLVSLAANQSHLEFVLKLDDDDVETISAVEDLVRRFPSLNLRTIVTPRGRGYLEMGAWTNMVSDAARGDWLLGFNDDMVMMTQDWDLILLGLVLPSCWHVCPEDVCVLFAETNGSLTSNETYIIRRKTYELMSRHLPCYIDSWFFEVLGLVKSVHRLYDIKVAHFREEVRDKTREETDAVFGSGICQLIEAGPITNIMSDAMRLLGHIERKTATTRWYLEPINGPGWYYWRATPNQRPFHLLLDGNGIAHLLAGSGYKYEPKDLGGMWYPRVTDKGALSW